jgi:ABC-2 type transport system permease protein
MEAYSAGRWEAFASSAGVLVLAAAAIYIFIYFLSGRLYMRGFSGAQGSPRFKGGRRELPEQRLAGRLPALRPALTLYWKDRLALGRDARYWSQLILIGALISVYLFSIRQLPLDTPDIRSLVSFLNVGVAGFVMAAIGLRFTFPAISLEGNSYWLIKAAPISAAGVMREKLLVSLLPSLAIGLVLITVSNRLLGADFFVAALSTFTILVAALAITVMGIGFGAAFPDFNVENIHQLESSYGGFLYMATCMGYLSLLVAVEAWPVQMHFAERFGRAHPWDLRAVAFSAALFLALNAAALYLPWKVGLRNLERHEI